MKYVSFILISFFLFGCDSTQDTKIIPPLAPSDLIEHSQEFEKQVISVSEKIHEFGNLLLDLLYENLQLQVANEEITRRVRAIAGCCTTYRWRP